MKMLIKNKMHPKNIYKTPPNFKELAISFPEFRKYVKQELSGKMTIDYQDPNAVKELTRTLLKKDFGLDVEINESHLVPRVPLCLNYILWVEDLLGLLNKDPSQTLGIDIGTGNICIYSLLASSKGWKMLATEVDKENYFNALNNVKKNNLENKITLKLVSSTNKLLCNVIDEKIEYDFCMCNPPFFAPNEKPQNRTSRRLQLETVASEVAIEVSTEGGEFSFILKLLQESKELKTQVKIYTSLVGKKSDFLLLKKEVQNMNPHSVAYTEFCQGRTTRWGLAWTFCDINLKVSNEEFNKPKKKKSKPLVHILPENVGKNLSNSLDSIKNILNELKIQFSEEIFESECLIYFTAFKNTWSHQRRKKRMQARGTSEAENCDEEAPEPKKLKLDESDSTEQDKTLIVEGTICLKKENSSTVIEMFWVSGNKESIHQIFQYFKNKWNTQSLNN